MIRASGWGVGCVIVLALWSSGCRHERPDWVAHGRQCMVASDSADASAAGLEILAAGGNAIDAATAVSFALGVTRPYSTGIGGGGFLIARMADGRVYVFDYREAAPRRARPDMYVRGEDGRPVPERASRDGHLAVGVPGLVAGRQAVLDELGTMPWERTLQPAIRLAREGFLIDKHFTEAANEALKRYAEDVSLVTRCGYVYRTYLNGGHPFPIGHRLRQPALARLMETLAAEGAGVFTAGRVATAIEREMAAHGGIVVAADLRDYQVRRREPILATYRGHDIITMPPPSSGGIAIAQTLNILERFDLHDVRRESEGRADHLMVEAFKHAFADRARYLADADFAPVPVELLTSKGYARSLRVDERHVPAISLERYGTVQRADAAGGAGHDAAQLPDDSGTSHYSIVDRWGNVVVATETINTEFGSLAAVEEWGLILNNEMDDFTSRPGEPNAYGLIQSDRNAPQPGKRPLSSMSPTIVLKRDKPVLMLGASGGPRIITSVLNVMINVLDFGLSLEDAMTAPRPHHQWQPDVLYFDQAPTDPLAEDLRSRGYEIADERKTGIVQAIVRRFGGWEGASDPRKGGRPAGG